MKETRIGKLPPKYTFIFETIGAESLCDASSGAQRPTVGKEIEVIYVQERLVNIVMR